MCDKHILSTVWDANGLIKLVTTYVLKYILVTLAYLVPIYKIEQYKPLCRRLDNE